MDNKINILSFTVKDCSLRKNDNQVDSFGKDFVLDEKDLLNKLNQLDLLGKLTSNTNELI